MAIVEKVIQEDLILYEILRNPVLFAEFIYNIDKIDRDREFLLDIYQKELLCDFSPYISLVAARAVGKTVSLSALILWLLVFNVFSEDYIVFTVPNKVHLEPVFASLTRLLRSNSFLKKFIEPKGGINNSDFSIKLLNSSVLICRIAGTSGTGANVIGLHTPVVLLDESGYYVWQTWMELQPILNTWQPGFRMITSGVPTGIREKSVIYKNDMEDDSYSKHRITAFNNLRFTEDDRIRAAEQYGGEDSDDYVHFVLGKHGKPIFSLFDRNTFSILQYPVYRVDIDGIKESENIFDLLNRLAVLPALPPKAAQCIFGIDLGYTEPTAIWVMYQDVLGAIKFHAKIKLTKVSYPLQEKIIDNLDSRFSPSVLGMDKGNVGMSVIQNLMEHVDYKTKKYNNRIVPIDFSSQVSLGMTSDGEEIKYKTKPFLVSILQEYTNNHKVIYSSTDMDMITELERMTYTKTQTGDIVYRTLTQRGGKRGEDHFTSALLCGIGAYYLTNEFTSKRKERRGLTVALWA